MPFIIFNKFQACYYTARPKNKCKNDKFIAKELTDLQTSLAMSEIENG